MKKMVVIFTIGLVFGACICYYIINSTAPVVEVSGILQYQPVPHPTVSAAPPEGFYVESTIYLKSGRADTLGKQVTASGLMNNIRGYGGSGRYPAVANDKIYVHPIRQDVAADADKPRR